jgi:hypothetical protein
LRKLRITAAVVLAAVAVLALLSFLTRPPHAAILNRPDWTPASVVVAGAYHIHSKQSDGSGSIDEIAAAAARAHLQFVIITDHGDGTLAPPPAYRHGVLVIRGVEISTTGGHYVALGMPAAPYPLGGSPRAVAEDVERLGGFGIAAHPTSPKPALRWTGWNLPFGGIEWLNADSQWRRHSRWDLAVALAHYPFGPAASLTAIFQRPDEALMRWDALTERRRVVGLAGADAHARIGFDSDDPRERGWFVRLPGYESSFRAFSNHVELARPLTGNAADDGTAILDALEAGHLFTSIDGFAGPAAFELRAESGRHEAIEGDDLLLDGPVTIHARSNDPTAEFVLIADGTVAARAAGPQATFERAAEPGVYRVEVRRKGNTDAGAMPWIVSNPIYVRQTARAAPVPFPAPAPSATEPLVTGSKLRGWRTEQDETSRVTIERAPGSPRPRAIVAQFTLGGGASGGQYVAVTRHLDREVPLFDHVAFSARASDPLRLFVELRDDRGQRWRHSVYLSTASREIVLPYTDFTPIAGGTAALNVAQIHTLLFVIDMTNARPGTKGSVTLGEVRLQR